MSRFDVKYRSLALVFWAALFLAGIASCESSPKSYVFFSLVFLAVISSPFIITASYSYLFICSFLFVGLWLKLTLTSWLHWPYTEPIGLFRSSVDAWDNVLLVCSVGGLGVIVAGVLFEIWLVSKGKHDCVLAKFSPPRLFLAWRPLHWGGVALLIILCLVANEAFGLLKLGHRPSWYLPWPFHGIYGWLMSVGFSMFIVTLFWWDVQAGFSGWLGIACLLLGASLVSISTFSRGLYLLQTMPLLVFALLDGRHVSVLGRKRLAVLIAVWICGLAITVSSANYSRYYSSFSNQPLGALGDSAVSAQNLLTGWAIHLVGRWPGLEGVMAVSSYPEKNLVLLLRVATERRVLNQADFYTAEVARSGYTDSKTDKHHYATISGPIAFFFYSGSLWIVFAGTGVLVIVLMVSERFLQRLTVNPVLCSMFGVYGAFLFVQLSSGLRQPGSSLFFTLLTVIALHYWRVFAYARHCASIWSNLSQST